MSNNQILLTHSPPHFLSGLCQQVCFIIISLLLQGRGGGGGGGGGGRVWELYHGGQTTTPLLGLETGKTGHPDNFPVVMSAWRNYGESGLLPG